MNNNDILRRVRYALDISNSEMAEIFELAGHKITELEILNFLKKEEIEGYIECSDVMLEFFLDGLIILKRGKKESSPNLNDQMLEPGNISVSGAPVGRELRISNNVILKKLRIALNFREGDMMEIFRLSGFEITPSELSALFRKKGHKNYKVCGDQILKHFIRGLTVHFRK